MAVTTVGFTTAGNHWRWVGNYYEEVQVGQLYTMPETGKILSMRLKVAGLGPYTDTVYHYQNNYSKVAACVWDAKTGAIIAKSAVDALAPEGGGSQTWKTFQLPDTWVEGGTRLIVGFWRIKTTTEYATQWDYNDAVAADGETYVQHDLGASSATGPIPFTVSRSTPGKSINWELNYQKGGTVKARTTSGTWANATARVYSGGTWVPGIVKVYNGTTWDESSG